MTRKIHIGTMGWSYGFWKNNFYSEKVKPENFLQQYSNHFDTVEVNSSFYRVPSVSDLKKWKNQTRENFIFSLKAPKKITYENSQKHSEYLDYFLESVSTLGPKLGPILFQFPPNFKFENFDWLKNLISILPKKYRYAIELRNKSWFSDATYSFFEENKITLVLTDNPWLKEIDKVTGDFIYFRWEGNRKQINGTKGIVEKDKSLEIKKMQKKSKHILITLKFLVILANIFLDIPQLTLKKF